MDLYSADVGAIQEGNMRSQAVMDANNKVREHNNNLAGQIASLKSSQKTGDVVEGLRMRLVEQLRLVRLPEKFKHIRIGQRVRKQVIPHHKQLMN